MPIFRRRLRLPPSVRPEPYPPMPEALAASWGSFNRQDETTRERTIGALSEWEARLPPAQQAYLRAEVVATLLATFGAEVGEAFENVPGMADGFAKGMTSLTLMYETFWAKTAGRALKDVAGVASVGQHFTALRQGRDRLIREAGVRGPG